MLSAEPMRKMCVVRTRVNMRPCWIHSKSVLDGMSCLQLRLCSSLESISNYIKPILDGMSFWLLRPCSSLESILTLSKIYVGWHELLLFSSPESIKPILNLSWMACASGCCGCAPPLNPYWIHIKSIWNPRWVLMSTAQWRVTLLRRLWILRRRLRERLRRRLLLLLILRRPRRQRQWRQ